MQEVVIIAKLTAVFDMKDRISKKLKTISGNMKSLEGYKKKLEKPTTILVGIKDKASSVIKRVSDLAVNLVRQPKDVFLRAKDMASRIISQIGSKLKSEIPAVKEVTIKAVDNFTKPLKTMMGAMTSTLGLLGIGGGLWGGIAMPLGLSADRQNITSAFEVLLGSADAAHERLEELTTFAGSTPFARDEIFRASRQLEVFTGSALSTGDGLRLVGDVATGTQHSLEETAIWFGRLYDGMANNQPIGMATSRLQEMGAISGEQRLQLEALAEAQGDINDKWAEAEQIFGRYNGMMDKMSNNYSNLWLGVRAFMTNNIWMPWGDGLREAFQPALESFRDWRKENTEGLEQMRVQINRAGEALGNVFTNVLGGIGRTLDTSFNVLFPDKDSEYYDMPINVRFGLASKNVADSFWGWWREHGVPLAGNLGSTIGKTYGSIIRGGLLGVFGANDPELSNPIMETAYALGQNFVTSFLEAFDPVDLGKRIGNKIKQVNIDAISGEGSWGSAIGTNLLAMFMLSKIPGGKFLMKGAGKLGLKGLGGLGKLGLKGAGKAGGTLFPSLFGKGAKTGATLGKGSSGVLKTAGKKIPGLSTLAAATNLIGINKENSGEKLGAFSGHLAGATGGAKAGAAIGTAFAPGIGTAIGGAIGSVVGAFAGSGLGKKIGGWLQESALFDASWWGSHWDNVKGWTASAWEGMTDIWGTVKTGISDTLFDSQWWSSQWDKVKEWTTSTIFSVNWWAEQAGKICGWIGSRLFNGEWWSYQWGKVKEWTEGTIFDPSWWSDKWESVKTLTSNAWANATEIWEGIKTKIGETIFNSEWWIAKWEDVINWTNDAWGKAQDIWDNISTAIGDTVFSSDWWGERWENVKDWTETAWEGAQSIWDDIKTTIGNTLFSSEWWSGMWDGVIGIGQRAWQGVGGWIGGIGESFGRGSEQTQWGGPAYANGGFINRPHLGLVGEAGPEVVIPLSKGRRARAMDLYESTGRVLGITPQNTEVNDAPRLNASSFSGATSNNKSPNSVKVVVEISGDNHFYTETDQDDFVGKVKQAVTEVLQQEYFESAKKVVY